MDPTTLMQLLAHLQQQGQMPGQMPQMGQMPPMQAQQSQGQLPSMSAPLQGQPGDPAAQGHHHGGGFNPLMLLSPLGGLFASNPKAGLMTMLSPMAGLMGAFK